MLRIRWFPTYWEANSRAGDPRARMREILRILDPTWEPEKRRSAAEAPRRFRHRVVERLGSPLARANVRTRTLGILAAVSTCHWEALQTRGLVEANWPCYPPRIGELDFGTAIRDGRECRPGRNYARRFWSYSQRRWANRTQC